MAFKFIVKDEDLPKPTVLSIIHLISIFLVTAVSGFIIKNNFPPYTIITWVAFEIIQVVYMSVFYKKIVWERYANSKLRTITVSFIASNIYIAIIFSFGFLSGAFFLSLVQLITSILFVLVITGLITIYLRKTGLLARPKSLGDLLKDFSCYLF